MKIKIKPNQALFSYVIPSALRLPPYGGGWGGEAVLFFFFPKHLALAYKYRCYEQIGDKGRENTDDSHKSEIEAHIAG